MFTEHPTCALCGISDRDVELTWLRHDEPDAEGNVYSTVLRCKDRTACSRRVEAKKEAT